MSKEDATASRMLWFIDSRQKLSPPIDMIRVSCSFLHYIEITNKNKIKITF